MEDIRTSIRKLKELLGYEFDYDWSKNNPPVKKEPEFMYKKDEAIIKVLDSIEEYLEEQQKINSGFYD